MEWVANVMPRSLYAQERTFTHCIISWVCPRLGLDACGKLVLTGIRSPNRPARSESLYRLSYLGATYATNFFKNNRFLGVLMLCSKNLFQRFKDMFWPHLQVNGVRLMMKHVGRRNMSVM